MFEGLDDINWRKATGGLRLKRSAPDYVRQLVSENISERRPAQGIIKTFISDKGAIYPSTPLVVPFILEILSLKTPPDPEELLRILQVVAHNCSAVLSTAYHISNPAIARSVTTYQALSAAHPLILTFLKHPSAEVRYVTIRLLMELMDQNAYSHHALKRLLKTEKHPVVLAAALDGLSRILSRERSFLKLIAGFLAPENDRLVRLAAASAWLKGARSDLYRSNYEYREHELPEEIPALIVEGITTPVDFFAYRDFGLEKDDLTFIRYYHLYARLTWISIDHAAAVLNSSQFTPQQTHNLAREMLERVFNRYNVNVYARADMPYWRWEHFRGWKKHAFTSAMYGKSLPPDEDDDPEFVPPRKDPTAHRDYKPGSWLLQNQQKVLRAIAACDAFWTIRTNLFSYFYGLPDDREALRHLAENPNV